MIAQTATTTTYDELCPGCDQADGAYWTGSTPDTDEWACRHCGTEWTIIVESARQVPPTAPVDRDIRAAAARVVNNAYGTNPRHTHARSGGCRDDCIPCGIARLRGLLRSAGVDVL